MKKMSNIDFLDYIYQEESQFFGSRNHSFLPGVLIAFSYNGLGNVTYTRPFINKLGNKSVAGYRITFGGQMIIDALDIPNDIRSPKEASLYIKKIRALFRAFYFHEMGHLLYTDMADDRFLTYKDKKHVGFVHSIFNILEDQVIERYGMSVDYPYTKKFFAYEVEKLFVPQAADYKDDPDSPAAFCNYLLLRLRLGKRFTGKSAAWEKDKKMLAGLVTNVLNETDATARITKSILLAEYIIKQNPNWKFEDVSAPQSSPMAGAPGTGTGTGAPALTPKPTQATSQVGQGGAGNAPQGGTGSGQVSNNRGADDTGTDGPIKKKDELGLPGEDTDVEETYNPDNDMLPHDCPHINDAFNDVLPENGGNHEWVVVKDYVEATPKVMKTIDERIARVASLANGIKQALNVYKGRTRPRYYRGYRSGKLDMRKAMTNTITHGCDTKLFQRKIAKGKEPDLAVSILCDNSGSMSGPKSHICTTAMLALAQACNLTKIPLEVNAFVHSGKNYTLHIKDFNDDFKTAKQYFGLTDSDINEHYNSDLKCRQFCSNEDEVNLYYVFKDFQRCKHRDKLLIVISDGATCGSTDRLRKIVQMIEKDGISVIGLGIDCDAVAHIYPNHQLFFGDESLKTLPSFLTTTLLKFAKGGK